MRTDALDYHLPQDRIAQAPVIPREDAKLFVYHRRSGERQHLHVRDLPSLLSENDCVVLNVTSVLRARLLGTLERTGRAQEVFLLREIESPQRWEALVKGHVRAGDRVRLPEGVTVTIEAPAGDGAWTVSFSLPFHAIQPYMERVGAVPVPPYIQNIPEPSAYETAYADPKERRSVAAPTAGFHLTPTLLTELWAKHVSIERIILDIGRGTFQPIRSATLESHVMHEERAIIAEDVAARISVASLRGQRVVAVGTTTVRALESAATPEGTVRPFDGGTELFITPGYTFCVVDALLTNFHLPRSSLLALVAAFIGSLDVTLDLYREAIDRAYRFYSFGDAMFIH